MNIYVDCVWCEGKAGKTTCTSCRGTGRVYLPPSVPSRRF